MCAVAFFIDLSLSLDFASFWEVFFGFFFHFRVRLCAILCLLQLFSFCLRGAPTLPCYCLHSLRGCRPLTVCPCTSLSWHFTSSMQHLLLLFLITRFSHLTNQQVVSPTQRKAPSPTGGQVNGQECAFAGIHLHGPGRRSGSCR